ncbi:MAG: tripartite tricarboxylate transporter permease, partial [Planctomycetota bacterium]
LFGISEVLNSMLAARRSTLEGNREFTAEIAESAEKAPNVEASASSAVSAAKQESEDPDTKTSSLLGSGAGMLFRRKGHVLRSASIGSLIGMLPGAGADIAAWVSFAVSKRFSKRPQLYGAESIEGIADATTANNAALAGAWIPALILGIPGDSVTAIVIGVLLMKNITPGPDIFVKQTELVYSIYVIFILANIMLIPVGLAAVKAASRLVRIPKAILLPAIVLFCIVGSYSLNASYVDVTVMLIMGVLGFVLERRRVPLAPIVLALILGPMVEERFIQTITGSDGSFTGFVNPQRPLALALAGVFALVWISAVVIGIRQKRSSHEDTKTPT